jgi:hypothetical protein
MDVSSRIAQFDSSSNNPYKDIATLIDDANHSNHPEGRLAPMPAATTEVALDAYQRLIIVGGHFEKRSDKIRDAVPEGFPVAYYPAIAGRKFPIFRPSDLVIYITPGMGHPFYYSLMDAIEGTGATLIIHAHSGVNSLIQRLHNLDAPETYKGCI